MVTNRSRFIAPLTSLRFFAAMGVVLSHSGAYRLQASGQFRPLANLLANGWIGVTFFFVLSGFILQKVYGGRLEDAPAKRRYAWARAARIYPVYLLALLATALFVADASWRSLPQFLMLQHWIPSRGLPLDNWNFPAWTLSVELLFYLVFPWFSRMATRFGVAALVGTGVVLASIMLILQTPAASIGPTVPMRWMFWTPLPVLRLPEFVFGIALGELSNRRTTGVSGLLVGTTAVVIPVILCLSTSPFVAPIVAILAGVLIFQTAHARRSAFTRALAWPPLVLLGGASYSIYLLATPVRMTFGWLRLTSFVALLAFPLVLVGVGILVFRLVEEPCRERLRSWGRQGPLAPQTSIG